MKIGRYVSVWSVYFEIWYRIKISVKCIDSKFKFEWIVIFNVNLQQQNKKYFIVVQNQLKPYSILITILLF